MSTVLSLQIEDHAPMAVCHLGGYFAQLEVYRFKSQIDNLVKEGRKFIILNMAQVTFLDSAGIGSIIQLRKELQHIQGMVYLAQSRSAQVRRTLAHSSLDKLIPTFEDTAEARRVMVRHFGIGQTVDETTNPRLGVVGPEPSETSFELTPDIAILVRMLEGITGRLDRIEHRLNTAAEMNHTVS